MIGESRANVLELEILASYSMHGWPGRVRGACERWYKQPGDEIGWLEIVLCRTLVLCCEQGCGLTVDKCTRKTARTSCVRDTV